MRSPNHQVIQSTYGKLNTCSESVATIATYCLPFFPAYVIGFELPAPGNDATHSSLPVFESNARMRRSFVAPTMTIPPAVAIGPALPLPPVFFFPSGSVSVMPSGTCQAMSPVFALTATSRAHGGRWHGRLAITRPFSSRIGALNVKYGPAPLTLPRSYGCLDPSVPRP